MFAAAIARARESAAVTVFAPPSELEAIRAAHGPQARVSHRPGSVLGPWCEAADAVDAVLLADVLVGLPDADAVHALRRAAESLAQGGRLLVLCDLIEPDEAYDHDLEHQLIEFALSGGGGRTLDGHLALFADAGLAVAERLALPWGYTVFELTPSSS
ncbi:hypothetical protein LEUCIP111803_02426 [Leucobacter soli]|uniref:O-methyltransferase domain-containing protein n=1 Tax=Leucobacter soli TaxID=2812850 RepID=A0A916K150_9MICO|nr:hypothetical protein LEUCIP111803_02426 [Leucobacter soli]